MMCGKFADRLNIGEAAPPPHPPWPHPCSNPRDHMDTRLCRVWLSKLRASTPTQAHTHKPTHPHSRTSCVHAYINLKIHDKFIEFTSFTTRFFPRINFIRSLHVDGRNTLGMYTKEKKLRNFSILKLFVTANNQELGNQFHSFPAQLRKDSFVNYFPS